MEFTEQERQILALALEQLCFNVPKPTLSRESVQVALELQRRMAPATNGTEALASMADDDSS